ncbi:hypothetical protein ACHAPV_008251 [Trichoderma viride]
MPSGHEAIVKLLLDKGAETKAKDEYGQTPLWIAADGGDETYPLSDYKMQLMLLKQQNDKRQMMHRQVQSDMDEISWGNRARTDAERGHEAIVKLLLDNGAEIEVRNSGGQTPLSYAAERCKEAIVKLLLEKGAEVEAKDNRGRTPLSFAAERGHGAIVKLLLDEGAEIEANDNSGQTPLSFAVRNRHEGMIKLLFDKGAMRP